MKTLVIWLMLCAGCWGQQLNGITAEKGIQQPAPQVAPLKCGKYEHVESVYSQLTGFKLRDTCAPDMHTLTEKEWQDLMQRIAWLAEVQAQLVKESKGK